MKNDRSSFCRTFWAKLFVRQNAFSESFSPTKYRSWNSISCLSHFYQSIWALKALLIRNVRLLCWVNPLMFPKMAQEWLFLTYEHQSSKNLWSKKLKYGHMDIFWKRTSLSFNQDKIDVYAFVLPGKSANFNHDSPARKPKKYIQKLPEVQHQAVKLAVAKKIEGLCLFCLV